MCNVNRESLTSFIFSFFAFHVSRFMLHLTLLVCILTTSLGAIACRPGGIRSWEEAIRFAQIELDESGDLEGRLDGYAEVATNLSNRIELLDQARPALDLISQLRDVRVPLIGNGWQILLALLSLATVDGAKVIAKLEGILNRLTRLKTSLDNMDSLKGVADAVRAFRADPDRHALVALSASSAAAMPPLRQLQEDLGKVLDPLKDVAGNLGGLVRGLRGAADAGIPAISDVAGQAAERIGLIEAPLLTLREGLSQLHQDIGTDVEVLEKIQDAVRQAREHEE